MGNGTGISNREISGEILLVGSKCVAVRQILNHELHIRQRDGMNQLCVLLDDLQADPVDPRLGQVPELLEVDVQPVGVDSVLGPGTQLVSPVDVVVTNLGQLLIANRDDPLTPTFDPSITTHDSFNGNIAPIAILAGTNTEFRSPVSIALTASGALLVLDIDEGGLDPPQILTYNNAEAGGNQAPNFSFFSTTDLPLGSRVDTASRSASAARSMSSVSS